MARSQKPTGASPQRRVAAATARLRTAFFTHFAARRLEADSTPASKLLVGACDIRQVCEQVKGGQAMKTLGDVKVGESSTIVKLHGEGALRRHLMDMGLIKGTQFKVVKVAPLGDPVEINVRGYELSIRKEEAAVVEVQ